MWPTGLPLIGLLALAPGPIPVHDIYSHLKNNLGASCCDNRDCQPARYRLRATGVEMLVDGQWVAVPDHKIQYRALPGDTGETGGGHWCGITNPSGLGFFFYTRCAVLPPQSTSAERAIP